MSRPISAFNRRLSKTIQLWGIQKNVVALASVLEYKKRNNFWPASVQAGL
jgi:hypothetical protein